MGIPADELRRIRILELRHQLERLGDTTRTAAGPYLNAKRAELRRELERLEQEKA